MRSIQPYKQAIAADLTSGDFEAATNRALSVYPSKRAALEQAYLTKDVHLFREICGLDVEFEVLPVPQQYYAPASVDYAPLIRGVAMLGGLAVFGATVYKVCAVIVTGAAIGVTAAVATATEYAVYIGGTLIAAFVVGLALRSKHDEPNGTHENINVTVNIHSQNQYGKPAQ